MTGGVTAGTAIAALQEAGSKLSRDMIYGGYRAYTHLCELCIELIRQFYDAPRCFRIMGEGGVRFLRFSNAGLLARPVGDVFGQDMGEAKPIYDIKVRSQKASLTAALRRMSWQRSCSGWGCSDRKWRIRPEAAWK